MGLAVSSGFCREGYCLGRSCQVGAALVKMLQLGDGVFAVLPLLIGTPPVSPGTTRGQRRWGRSHSWLASVDGQEIGPCQRRRRRACSGYHFFTALGMTLEGEVPVEGPWVDRVNGLESVQVDIVMMRTPVGHGRLELTKFRNSKLVEIEPAIAPPNTLGLRSVMFTVDRVDNTVARLRVNGAELVGEVAQYEEK
jgi:hypothetical protein